MRVALRVALRRVAALEKIFGISEVRQALFITPTVAKFQRYAHSTTPLNLPGATRTFTSAFLWRYAHFALRRCRRRRVVVVVVVVVVIVVVAIVVVVAVVVVVIVVSSSTLPPSTKTSIGTVGAAVAATSLG